VQKGIFSNILALQIRICWYVYSGSTQNLYIVYTLSAGVCLCGLALQTDGQPDLRTRTSAENRVILGQQYKGYVSNLETLEVRQEKLCLSFGKKCL
jgi:hypothetical protein